MTRLSVALLTLLLAAALFAITAGCISVNINLPGEDDGSHSPIMTIDDEPVQDPMPEPSGESSQEAVQEPAPEP